MGFASPRKRSGCHSGVARALAFVLCASTYQLVAQLPDAPAQTSTTQPSSPSDAHSSGSVTGIITDSDRCAIPASGVEIEDVDSKANRTTTSDEHGVFLFSSVPPGKYIVTVHATGFSPWKINDVIVVHEGEDFVVPEVQLGVESINTTVNAISMEDLAEQQITAEEHQRILGILPNFYVSYLSDTAPLTRKQKFKLAIHVSIDPMTYFTTGVTAGIEQWQGRLLRLRPGIFRLCQAIRDQLRRPTQLNLPCPGCPCCRRCCTRTRATSTADTDTSSSARCTPFLR